MLRPGDVIEVPGGKFSGFAVVVDPGVRADKEGPRPYVVTLERHARRLSMIDFPTPVVALTRLKVPRSFNGRDPKARRDLAQALHLRTRDLPPRRQRSGGGPGEHGGAGAQVDAVRAELRQHPCHSCPDREEHSRWAERWFKLDRDAGTLRRRIEQRTNTIARRFDRICEVLTRLDYLTVAGGETQVNAKGRRLQRIYAELDLVARRSAGAGPVVRPVGLRAGRRAVLPGL